VSGDLGRRGAIISSRRSRLRTKTDDGEPVDPLWASDTAQGQVVWQSEKWLRESKARTLCEIQRWRLDIDR
jgi:hypothetical protein